MVFLLFPGDLGLVGSSGVKVQGIYTNLNGSDRCSGNAAEGVVEARWAGEGPSDGAHKLVLEARWGQS